MHLYHQKSKLKFELDFFFFFLQMQITPLPPQTSHTIYSTQSSEEGLTATTPTFSSLSVKLAEI